MPYAQNHYPFENKQLFEQSFPADFIAEGLDQVCIVCVFCVYVLFFCVMYMSACVPECVGN